MVQSYPGCGWAGRLPRPLTAARPRAPDGRPVQGPRPTAERAPACAGSALRGTWSWLAAATRRRSTVTRPPGTVRVAGTFAAAHPPLTPAAAPPPTAAAACTSLGVPGRRRRLCRRTRIRPPAGVLTRTPTLGAWGCGAPRRREGAAAGGASPSFFPFELFPTLPSSVEGGPALWNRSITLRQYRSLSSLRRGDRYCVPERRSGVLLWCYKSCARAIGAKPLRTYSAVN